MRLYRQMCRGQDLNRIVSKDFLWLHRGRSLRLTSPHSTEGTRFDREAWIILGLLPSVSIWIEDAWLVQPPDCQKFRGERSSQRPSSKDNHSLLEHFPVLWGCHSVSPDRGVPSFPKWACWILPERVTNKMHVALSFTRPGNEHVSHRLATVFRELSRGITWQIPPCNSHKRTDFLKYLFIVPSLWQLLSKTTISNNRFKIWNV